MANCTSECNNVTAYFYLTLDMTMIRMTNLLCSLIEYHLLPPMLLPCNYNETFPNYMMNFNQQVPSKEVTNDSNINRPSSKKDNNPPTMKNNIDNKKSNEENKEEND